MQIQSFVLYHQDRKRQRVLELSPGLNVISGWRNTGKSSLLEIVEYCFGKEKLEVAHGPIRESVLWYGLVLRHQNAFAFAGRPKPREKAAGTSDAMWLPLTDATPPPVEDLAANTNIGALRGHLSAFSNFAEYRFDPPEDAYREALHLHVAHVLPACLQDEEDIDSKTHLFHRDAEREVKNALRDALPYWLGASDEKTPNLRFRLTQVKREIAHSQRALDRIRAAKSEADSRGLALLAQAAEVGIAAPLEDGEIPSGQDLSNRLRQAAEGDISRPGKLAPTGEIERLLAERKALHERLADSERDEALLRDFGADRKAFDREKTEQRARLASIGLLPHSGEVSVCPVCARDLEEADPSAEALSSQLRRLDAELQSVADLEPRDRKALEEVMANTARLRQELQAVNATLRDHSSREKHAGATRELASKQAFVQGLATEYLRTISADDPQAEERLVDQINRLEAEKLDLLEKVDAEGEQERLKGAVNIIGVETTSSVRELSLEYADESQVRLDLGKMTLMLDTPRSSFPLSGVGGAGTRVGYHLAAHFALHSLLRQRDRPGPAFLILDQPTGPFYPEKTDPNSEPRLKKEDDRAVVADLFDFIRRSTEELGDEIQVLVLDHFAAFGESWFDDALVGNWREGQGLLPGDWL
jgi:hypothetical protein